MTSHLGRRLGELSYVLQTGERMPGRICDTETYIIVGFFTTILKMNLLQFEGRPRFDCVHCQLPLDGAICTVLALCCALPEIIVYRGGSVDIDHQSEHYQPSCDRYQCQ